VSESPLPDRAHPEAQRHIDTEVSMEPLQRLKFVRQFHRVRMAALRQ